MKKILFVIFIFCFYSNINAQTYIDFRKPIRLVYNSDTMIIGFSGDTMKIWGNNKNLRIVDLLKLNELIIRDTTIIDLIKKHGGSGSYISSKFGNGVISRNDSILLNDTIFTITDKHTFTTEVIPENGTYNDYSDTSSVKIEGYRRVRSDYFPEVGDPDYYIDSVYNVISVADVTKGIHIRSEGTQDAAIPGTSYLELNGSTAYFNSQDSSYNGTYTRNSQWVVQPEYIYLQLDNTLDEYSKGKSIRIKPDSIWFDLRSGYEFPSANITTVFKEGEIIINSGSSKVRIGIQLSGSLTDGTPTAAEITSIVGVSAATAGAGFQVTIKDSDGTGLLYKVESDGTNWFYVVMTQAS